MSLMDCYRRRGERIEELVRICEEKDAEIKRLREEREAYREAGAELYRLALVASGHDFSHQEAIEAVDEEAARIVEAAEAAKEGGTPAEAKSAAKFKSCCPHCGSPDRAGW